MKLYTIGFTKKSASTFFGLLQKSGAERLVDVRLNNVSQLAGFAKRDDLAYFLTEICGMDYRHELELAPTKSMLDDYKKHGARWDDYERWFLDLIAERRIEDRISPSILHNAVLLCSEATPHQCHRRLVAEYLAERWDDVTIEHL
ncbi:DUF488 domain-containing protein [Nocardioides allogilvus]|uniref:DUF488 domain-containing protein n=1 Tax=Nocardioides allogilvus TaxID=2072017 RepID=UPI000D314C7C|nr:DUF488 domain-containing protein [Nocardioides allogilvus]